MPTSKKERGPHTKKARDKKGIDPRTLAGRVRAAREATGLTTRKFADLIEGVSHVTVTHIENAETDAGILTVKAVLGALRKKLGDVEYLKYFPLDLDVAALKGGGKITEKIILEPPLPAGNGADNPNGKSKETAPPAFLEGTPKKNLMPGVRKVVAGKLESGNVIRKAEKRTSKTGKGKG